MIDLAQLSIKKARAGLLKGDFSARELSEAYLASIAKHNPDTNAYLEVFSDVKEMAQHADERLRNEKESSPLLCGIPLAIKDNILIEGKKATAASKILEGYVASYDATVITKLKAQGVVFLGRANLDEFAMGGSNEYSAFGPVKNPLDLSRVPGGSSGGPAAAVSMDGALVALGSDTGGSVRLPASFCGLVGLKPTYGSVSRYGLIAMGSSLDVIGPLAKTVSDAQMLFDAVRGQDPFDSTSLPSGRYSPLPPKEHYTIGVPFSLLESGIDADVRERFDTCLSHLTKEGHNVVDVSLPSLAFALATYYIVMPAEASTNLARFDGVRFGLFRGGESLYDDYVTTRGEGFGKEPRRRIILGTYVLSAGYYDAYYRKALVVRSKMAKEFAEVFQEVDVVATPTSPTPAFQFGEKKDPLSMYLTDIFTVPANLTGIPAISIPGGSIVRDGVSLPVGVQLMGNMGQEETLFALGEVIEHTRV